MNNIIFKYILYLERSLKTKVSYVVSKEYGVYTDPLDLTCSNPSDYLCRNYYSRSTGKRQNILKNLKQCITNNHHNNIIEHYVNNKNHIPAWILTYNVPFGLAIEWYSILKKDDKTYVCDEFIQCNDVSLEDRKEFLYKALLLAKEYRNKIAHGNRTFNVSGLPILPKKQLLKLSNNIITSKEYNKGLSQCDLSSIMILLILLLNDYFLSSNLLSDFSLLFLPYENQLFNNKNIYEIFNLPQDILSRLLNLINYKYNL